MRPHDAIVTLTITDKLGGHPQRQHHYDGGVEEAKQAALIHTQDTAPLQWYPFPHPRGWAATQTQTGRWIFVITPLALADKPE